MATFALPFCEIPEDLQLRILSFLTPTEISSFACTSKRFASLCQEDGKIWHAMCNRRWGKKTKIQKWGNGQVAYRLLYKTLKGLDNLIGFWRLCGRANPAASSPPLVFFDWGPSFVLGSRVLSTGDDTYQVKKTPFLLMGISPEGRSENFLDLGGGGCNLRSWDDFEASSSGDLVPVDVNFMGNGHIMVEENRNNFREEQKSSGDESDDVISSPDFSEMYTQFANKTSPGGERRRQRRKEKERQASRTKWEPEHFIKVADCSPTPTKPLQGLWKGFCEGRNMELYLVKYDEVGGIICRKVEDLSLSRHTPPVFWTPNHLVIRSPFSAEEELLLNSRIHVSPLAEVHENVVSGMLYMKSSYDMVLQGEAGNGNGFLRGEGRVWLYENGTFSFGFLRDQFIIDLKHVALEDGCLADELVASL
ncbi:PREDICTED: F-box protein At3g12350-like isoform X1 [Camelina sativa]|uniref:F-box protein n=1 Tax=Camelina sativa TaxID=90675 RepID=A0ABM1RAV3_CAMSA|nr:PREDICTED: F-box protein At3g12350-like isoform X1 [Camelina sativa]